MPLSFDYYIVNTLVLSGSQQARLDIADSHERQKIVQGKRAQGDFDTDALVRKSLDSSQAIIEVRSNSGLHLPGRGPFTPTEIREILAQEGGW